MKQYGTILIVDDNRSILTAMHYLLDSTFERVLTLEKPDEILKTMAQEEIDIVLLDMNFWNSECQESVLSDGRVVTKVTQRNISLGVNSGQ